MNTQFDLTKELLPGLPAYEGGRMSDKTYNAGVGRHAMYNDGKPQDYEGSVNVEKARLELHRMELMGCKVHVEQEGEKEFKAEISGEEWSLRGELTEQSIRASFMSLRPDVGSQPPCLLRAVTETDRAAFDAYIALLQQQGFACIWENQIEENAFRELQKDGRLIYASFMGREGTARFIDDTVSAPITAYSGGTATGKKTELCQFGLFYDRMIHGVSADCGMLYMIKLPDDSLFLVDGGEYEQATDAAADELFGLMRSWTGTAPGEKIRIAGWFCTHAHDDHLDMFSKLIRFHHDEMDLQRIIFNFPASEFYQLMPSAYATLERQLKYYPDALYLKPHAGQEFTLAGVKFQFLQTHEDSIGAAGDERIGGFNDTSTVLKVSFDGVSFMILGDISNGAENILVRNYSETLHSTAVQAAHHLINLLPEAYVAIAPAIALIPSHYGKADPENPKYLNLLRSVPRERMYFAFEGTTIWEEKDGKLVMKEKRPVVGGLFDNSQI